MRAIRVRLLALTLLACGCSGVTERSSTDDDAALEAALPSLDAQGFTHDLEKAFFASTESWLTTDSFDAKWKASRSDSALMFFRAYPDGYHHDFAVNLTPAARRTLPAEVGLCFGDPHPDNFGFLQLGGAPMYAFNDLDDSGTCPVALDALRYVTSVRLYFDDGDLVDRVAQRYVDVLSGAVSEHDATKAISKIANDYAPNFDKHRKDKLGELATGDALRFDDAHAIDPVTAEVRTAVTSAVTRALDGITVLDVASVKRESGGSAGLPRYWALVRRGGVQTIIELKQAATPGVDFGLSAHPIARGERLGALKKAFWNTATTSDYVYATALGQTFLLRDRLAKASLDLGKLKKKELADVLDAQASMVALVHKPSLRLDDARAKALHHWLNKSSSTVADRWKQGYR